MCGRDKQVSLNMNTDAPAAMRDEEADSKSGSDNSDQQPKRKRYHRHTAHQIQEMEAFFKECPHPDDRQRRELGRELGMDPLQVKFWFQNKRTQMKTQHEHHENTQLRAENEKLRAENLRYREALSNAACPNCGGPTPLGVGAGAGAGTGDTSFHEHQLRVENARLREEIDHISAIATKYVGKPFTSSVDTPSASSSAAAGSHHLALSHPAAAIIMGGSIGNGIVYQNKSKQPAVIELAVAAMEELVRMGQLGEPLWVPSTDRLSTVLNEDEYLRSCSRVFGARPLGFKSEASRESALLAMDASSVVEILMDVEKWGNVFSGVISRATNLQVLASGIGGSYNETLQVMNAEFHVLSPLVPTRESYFVRYCKQHVDGTWAVVDVSLDHLQTTPMVTCRRRPSGCIIQDIPNEDRGYSKVIWVEHVEVQESSGSGGGIHSIFKPLVAAGLAFGAKRWLAILEGQCQRRLADSDGTDADADAHGGDERRRRRRSMIRLGDRMVSKFCRGVSASIANAWTTLSGNDADNVKVMTRKNVDDLTMPLGIQLSIATSFWLPASPRTVFDFLRDHANRKEWDMLWNGAEVEEVVQVLSGNDACNNVSICQLKGANESGKSSSSSTLMMVQESRSNPTASYVVYAPIDMASVKAVTSGTGDPSYVPLLPSGFAILPDGPTHTAAAAMPSSSSLADSGGTLLTVALQVLVDPSPDAKLSLGSVAIANNLLNCTIDKIRNMLAPQISSP
ncbi:homeobox-leucine zipper protein ROC1-like [Andrographis paniculata]|uniref:homeobox-leucine zipper protein ROC1-like n=1 Tax=Andrographis paniculata TaxID=175694 RepID=UPI0021E7317F|nr:homeobox-leucine zipper protein ROC1-like [Andrographis paniculata]